MASASPQGIGGRLHLGRDVAAVGRRPGLGGRPTLTHAGRFDGAFSETARHNLEDDEVKKSARLRHETMVFPEPDQTSEAGMTYLKSVCVAPKLVAWNPALQTFLPTVEDIAEGDRRFARVQEWRAAGCPGPVEHQV